MEMITEAEARLRIVFPEPVRSFYMACNGVQVNEPAVTILPMQDLQWNGNRVLHLRLRPSHCIQIKRVESYRAMVDH